MTPYHAHALPTDAVADYGRKYMEYGIENGTVGKAWAW